MLRAGHRNRGQIPLQHAGGGPRDPPRRLRGAIACLQTFCHRPENVKAAVEAGVIGVLVPLLSRPNGAKALPHDASADEQSSDPRFGAVDTIGTLSNHHEGKLAIGKSDRCLRALVQICHADDATGLLQEGAMHSLGQLIFNQECWQPLIDAGALGAAVAMLRESKTTPGGAARAGRWSPRTRRTIMK